MEKKGPQMDDHSSAGNIPEPDSYEIIDSPLLESLKNVFSLIEPAKQEIEEARRASLSTSSKQHAPTQTLDVEELRLALGRAEQEIRALKNSSCNHHTDNKSENAEKHLQEKIKAFELRIIDLQKENEKLKCNVTEEKNAYQDVIKHQEEVITGMKAKHSAVGKTFKEMQDTISRLSKEKEKDVAAVQKELSESKTRLSKLMGDKLSNKNPDIADLSDSNRPTKLAEKFSELYDNQWTDAYETAERLFKDQKEEYGIKVLLQLLMNVNKFCLEEFRRQESDLMKTVLRTSKPQTEIPAAILKELKDYWKSTAEVCIPELVEKYLQNETITSVKKLANAAKEFTNGCVSVCWLMAHQDPKVVFHLNVKRLEIADGNFYKAYTQSGKQVDYIVWPALLLHEGGPLLAKGVVQYIKPDEKKNENTQDLLKKPVTNLTKTENEQITTSQSQQESNTSLPGYVSSQSLREKSGSSLNNTTDFSKSVNSSTPKSFDMKAVHAEFDEVAKMADNMAKCGRKSISEEIQQQNQQQNQQQQQQHHPPLSTCQQNLSAAQQQHYQQQHQHQLEKPQQHSFQHVDARNYAASATYNQQQNQYHPQQNAQSGSQLMTGGFQQNVTNRDASSGVQNQTMSYYSMLPTQNEISWFYYYININNNNYDRARFQMNSEFYFGCYEKCCNYLLRLSSV